MQLKELAILIVILSSINQSYSQENGSTNAFRSDIYTPKKSTSKGTSNIPKLNQFKQSLYPIIDRATGKKGFINGAGQTVISCKYDEVPDKFTNGVAVVKLNGEWGCIDVQGQTVIPFQSSYIDFGEGLAGVEIGGKYGYIDKSGKTKIPFIYKSGQAFSEGLACVRLQSSDLYGFINKGGNMVIQPQFDYAVSFHNGLAYVKNYDQYGYIDKQGKIVIQYQYDRANDFSDEGLACVTKNGKSVFINKMGKVVIPCEGYKVANYFQEGLATVTIKRKFGFIDASGSVVIPCQYDWAGSFEDGLAVVQSGDKKGYIDKFGNWVLSPIFEYAQGFRDGIGLVCSTEDLSDSYYINKKGESIHKRKVGGEVVSNQNNSDHSNSASSDYEVVSKSNAGTILVERTETSIFRVKAVCKDAKHRTWADNEGFSASLTNGTKQTDSNTKEMDELKVYPSFPAFYTVTFKSNNGFIISATLKFRSAGSYIITVYPALGK